MANVLILYYSMYGHIYQLAQAALEGAKSTGATVEIRRVPETLSKEVLEKMHATATIEAQASIPVATINDLRGKDAILFGTPTRFGNMCGQMKQFLDATGKLWAEGALSGKVAGVFTSSDSQHGGNEVTALTFFPPLLHHGMIIAGLPYSFKEQQTMSEISGGTPYGASTISGENRQPSKIDLDGARFQGKYIAEIANKLFP